MITKNYLNTRRYKPYHLLKHASGGGHIFIVLAGNSYGNQAYSRRVTSKKTAPIAGGFSA